MLNSSDFSIDMNDCELSNLNFVMCFVVRMREAVWVSICTFDVKK